MAQKTTLCCCMGDSRAIAHVQYELLHGCKAVMPGNVRGASAYCLGLDLLLRPSIFAPTEEQGTGRSARRG